MSANSPPVDVGEHLGLAVHVANRFVHRAARAGIDLDEVIGEAFLGLVRAGRKYEAARGAKFGTFAFVCIERSLKNFFKGHRRHNRLPQGVEDGSEFDVADQPVPDQNSVEDREVAGILLASLTPRQREVVELLYGIGGQRQRTPREVAQALSISSAGVNQLHQRALERMRSWAEERGMVGVT